MEPLNLSYEEKLINLFNKVLKDEISASVLYRILANKSSSPKLQEELTKHAEEEYTHFNKLIDYISNHGLLESVNYSLDQEIINNTSCESLVILNIVQELEKIAIEDYKFGALLARDNKDIETESFFLDLMKEEQQHFDDLALLNGQKRSVPLTFSDYIKSLGSIG